MLATIIRRHRLEEAPERMELAQGGTWVVWLGERNVIKLFVGLSHARAAWTAERAALLALAADPLIPAPRLLGEGGLSSVPYLVTTRVRGIARPFAELPYAERRHLAAEIGQVLGRLHALPAVGLATPADWRAPGAVEAAARSVLPRHLVAQVEGFLARLPTADPVPVHADIMHRHVLADGGRLAGMIDWGDAMLADRHLELAKIHLDLFDADPELLRVLLDASNWPVGPDFDRLLLGMALRRQAIGLGQHPSMDVFHKLPALLPLAQIASLDELADVLVQGPRPLLHCSAGANRN